MSFTTGHALVIGVGQYQFMGQHNVPIAARGQPPKAAL
jgi:hypothetical protein